MWVKGASAPGASGRRCSLPFRCCACRYVCRALVPRACPFRMAPALCPSAGPSAPARASPHTCTPLKPRAKAAARVAIPRARLPRGGIVPHALRPCRACAEHTPFFAEKAFDFHRLRPSQHALPLSGIIPDKRGKRPDIPLLQHGGITA